MSVSNFIPEVWSAQVLENFQDRAVLANTVAREYEGDARFGNVVHITQFDTPQIIDYAEGNGGGARTIEPQELTSTRQSITIDRERAFAYYVDDIDRAQAAGSLGYIADDAALALANDAESFIASLIETDGTAVDSVEITNGDTAFDVVMALRTQLTRESAPLGGRYLAVNPEFARYLLGADSKLTNVDMSGSPAGLRDAVIGRLLGFTVVESNHVGEPGVPTAYAYHTSAIGFVLQLDGTEAVRDTRKFADIVRGLTVSGGAVLRPESTLVFRADVGGGDA